jgi:RNA polymerase sigma-70 factor, ECF subfamily
VGSYCLARLGNAELAEEITSRVFLTVVRHFADVRGSSAGWLWTVVRSELTNHYRARQRTTNSDAGGISTDKSPQEQMESDELQRQLYFALQQISENEQQIIYLKFFQDMPNHEIAEAAGLSASNVGVIVFRALKRLRHLMEAAPPPAPVRSPRQPEMPDRTFLAMQESQL